MAEKRERVPVAKTYKIYIDGRFPRTESGRYFTVDADDGSVIANVCRSSAKDVRNAVVAARKSLAGWSGASAFLRGQILYRIAEMLEGRREQFIAEALLQGTQKKRVANEVDAAIDSLVYYAGWSDKYQQVFSSVNPVSSPHFNFSVLEPTGVVGILAPEAAGLAGLVAYVAPAIVGGNSCIVLASTSQPLSAVSFAEVLHASDVPAGVVNILTGFSEELRPQFASHMDVNAVICSGDDRGSVREMQLEASANFKRVVVRSARDWLDTKSLDPYLIRDTQEIKTTWHPVGR